ncbi:hypothetical protein AB5L52_37205 [Streptomyces sp. CG4]|uniref:hypothetical protein n=1 Tax=Streptomyces sp. CG4 TaxID=408783 RepID=UPI0034E19503
MSGNSELSRGCGNCLVLFFAGVTAFSIPGGMFMYGGVAGKIAGSILLAVTVAVVVLGIALQAKKR